MWPAAFPSYLCRRHVGRIHDPGLAWGAAAAPSGEKRQSHKCPPRKRTPPLWKEGQENETYFHSPEGPLVPLVTEKSIPSLEMLWGLSWGRRQSIAPQIPMRPSQSISPPLVLGLRRAVWVSPGSPCWGRRCRVEALPQSLPAGTQRSGQGVQCGQRLLEGAEPVLGQKEGRRLGLVGVGVKVQALRWKAGGRFCARRS